MKIAVIGASGFVGLHLVPFLQSAGHEVVSIGRDLDVPPVDAIINLAGANIFGKKWDAAYKQEIEESRVRTCETLQKTKPKIFLCASAIAAESTFLHSVVQKWEEAASHVPAERTVMMRFGVVLEPSGGALQEMVKQTKLLMGARLGKGDQYFAWIAMKDLLRGVLFCLENEHMRGPVHFVAPHAVPQKRFIEVLGRAVKRPILLTLPQKVARLMLGEVADEVLYKSLFSMPEELTDAGFTFDLPNIEAALEYYLGGAP